jgi:hypothetical protein
MALRADLDVERERMLREGSGDHFYGRWFGGSKSSGGHVASSPADTKAISDELYPDKSSTPEPPRLNSLNARLRSGETTPDDAASVARWDALTTTGTVTKDTVTCRGQRGLTDKKVGDTFADKGFPWAGPEKDALSYAPHPENGVLIRYHLPKGHHAAVDGRFLILPRDRSWRVTKVSTSGLKRVLDVEPVGSIREAGGDHFYGAWKGGAKGEGGRPGASSGPPEVAVDKAKRAAAFKAVSDAWDGEPPDSEYLNGVNERLRTGTLSAEDRADLPLWDDLANASTASTAGSVYRGETDRGVGSLAVGSSYSDKGFAFTSVDRARAVEYVGRHGEGGKPSVLLHYRVQPGVAMVMDGPTDYVMGRGQRWRVAASRMEGGIRVVDLDPEG